VVVIENRTLYAGPKADIQVGDAPEAIGGHRLRRSGADVTVVTWGAITSRVLASADRLADEGIEAEVIEAVWLNPFDHEAVAQSVARTGRLVVVHEANTTGGFGAEILARVVEGGTPLKSPPRRVGARDSRIPAAVGLAAAVLPQDDDIVQAVRSVVGAR
jgi:pyruvate/2-oxoglutarate/acetoin dehydrogenase E1 component